MKKLTFAIIPFICSLLCLTVWAQQAEQPAYKNSQLPVEQRVGDLISRMTLEEKVSQLGHTADAVPRLGIPEYNWWNEGLHGVARAGNATVFPQDRKSTRLNSSHSQISYAVFCLKKKKSED